MKAGKSSYMVNRQELAGIFVTVWAETAGSLNEHTLGKNYHRLEIEDNNHMVRCVWNFSFRQSALETQKWVMKQIAGEILEDKKLNVQHVIEMVAKEMPLLDPLFGE